MLARAWLDHHRFPSEVLALPRSERALLIAAIRVQDEANEHYRKTKGKTDAPVRSVKNIK